MTAFNSVKSGNFINDNTVLSPASLPGPGDTITFNASHDLIMSAGQSLTCASIIDNGGTFTVMGAALTTTAGASCSFGLNSGTTLRMPMTVQNALDGTQASWTWTGKIPVLNFVQFRFLGTSRANRVLIGGTLGDINSLFANPGVISGVRRAFMMNAQYFTISNLGDKASSTSGIYHQYANSSVAGQDQLTYDNGTFTNCHLAPNIVANSHGVITAEINCRVTNCNWTSTPSGSYCANFACNATSGALSGLTTGTLLVDKCSFDQSVQMAFGGFYQFDWTFTNCYFDDSAYGNPSQLPWAQMDNCVVRTRSGFAIGEHTMGGPLSNNFICGDGNDAWHELLLLNRNNQDFWGNQIDVVNPGSSKGYQRLITQAEGGIYGTLTYRRMHHNIVTAESGPAFYVQSNSAGYLATGLLIDTYIYNNTFMVPTSWSGAWIIQDGTTVGAQPDTCKLLANNIFHGVANAAVVAFSNQDPGIPSHGIPPYQEILLAANAYNNWRTGNYSFSSRGDLSNGTIYDSTMTTGSLPSGQNDVNSSTQLADPTRHIWTWAVLLDGAGAGATPKLQYEYALAKLKVQYFSDDPSYDSRYTTAALMAYLRSGYTPTNAACFAAGSDGLTVGAIQVNSSSSSQTIITGCAF